MSDITVPSASTPEENEMLKKIKEMLGEDDPSLEDMIEEPTPPLEEALERALYALSEIVIYAEYGRSKEAAREATEALEALNMLKTKWIDQNKIMETLTTPASELNKEHE